MAGNFCAGNVVYGLSKHRPVAMWAIFEAIANLGLSIWLVGRWGVIGVAWGTVLPSWVINVVLWPRYITRLLDIPLRRYLFQSWARPALAVIPFGLACFAAESWWPARHLSGFFLQMAALLPIALAGVALIFRQEISRLVRGRDWLLRATSLR
jgi:O-antigen/teichoic acid export membrane protein